MSLVSSFPEWYTPREIQRELISEIDSKLKSGYRRIVLCAPTGVGKSLIGATVARHFGSSFTVTASKHLQDQYIRDVPILKPVKGKSNFACLQIMRSESVSDEARAASMGFTCDKGACQVTVTKDGKKTTEVCKYKPKIADVAQGIIEPNSCHYYIQKYEALAAPHSLWNYAAFFQIMRYNRGIFAEYLNREVAVFDEAHKLEDQVVKFVGYSVYGSQLEQCRLDPREYDMGSIDSITQMLYKIRNIYRDERNKIKNEIDPHNPNYTDLTKIEGKLNAVEKAYDDVSENPSNFVVSNPSTDFDGSFKSVSISPVDVSGFVEDFLDSKYQLFMSATIDKTSFCQNIGLDPEEVALVDAPRSPFPAENRQVRLLNTRRLNYRSTPDDEAAVIAEIDRIMTGHAEHRGLILTSSVSRCYSILEGLSPDNARRIRICHSTNRGGKTQSEIVTEHANDPSGVLLSSSLWEGVDLKDGLSRFQIVAKIPYPPLQDKRVRAKKEQSPAWYQSQTATKLLQGLGRSIRGEGDWAVTYVLDGSVENVLRNDHLIPKAYRDVLGLAGPAL